MKNILITGANSYIGEAVMKYLKEWPDLYSVSVKDTIEWTPKVDDFLNFDVVFNVAGIAHIKEKKSNKHLYYKVNRDLVVAIAESAKEAGVKHFILLSSMSVYGLTTGHINKDTPVNPKNAYGKSKAEADERLLSLSDKEFHVVCLRPPMVYGKGCKGNYQRLRSIALKSPLFPSWKNERSMIFIGNLCEFVKGCIDRERQGVFFPQNAEYVNTSEMVQQVAFKNGRKIKLTSLFNWLIKILPFGIMKKVFGDLTYEKVDTVDKYSFDESIGITEE